MIKGKQPEEIRKLFNIQNDFTPEEEAQIRRENVRWLHFLYILYKAHTYRNGPKIARVMVACYYFYIIDPICTIRVYTFESISKNDRLLICAAVRVAAICLRIATHLAWADKEI